MPSQAELNALKLVAYSMIYIQSDLYSEKLFSENFCSGFRRQFDAGYHADILNGLRWASQNPDYPFEELEPLLKMKYSRADIFYYFNSFYLKLKECS